MAISNDKITNRLDKKINFGVARTAKDSVVAPSGEVLSSPLFNPGDTVLIDADQLRGTTLLASPAQPASTNDQYRRVYIHNADITSNDSAGSDATGDVAGVVELYPFPASAEDSVIKTFVAAEDISSTGQVIATRLQDWLSFGEFGPTQIIDIAIAPSGYHLQNKDLSGETGYEKLPPGGTEGFEFYFDVDAGTLTFPNGVPSGYDASTMSFYIIKGARYIGRKGIKSLSVAD